MTRGSNVGSLLRNLRAVIKCFVKIAYYYLFIYYYKRGGYCFIEVICRIMGLLRDSFSSRLAANYFFFFLFVITERSLLDSLPLTKNCRLAEMEVVKSVYETILKKVCGVICITQYW